MVTAAGPFGDTEGKMFGQKEGNTGGLGLHLSRRGNKMQWGVIDQLTVVLGCFAAKRGAGSS